MPHFDSAQSGARNSLPPHGVHVEHPAERSAASPQLTLGDVMTADDVARVLAVPKSTIEAWARRGLLPSRKRGKRRFYLRWEIYEWLSADDP